MCARFAKQGTVCALLSFVAAGLAAGPALASSYSTYAKRIERITGVHGKVDDAESAVRISVPRTDVQVTVDGVPLDPAMGLTSWAGFHEIKDGQFLLMGELVLFQDEINSIMSLYLDQGLQVTSVQSRFLNDDPRVFFVRVGGEGSLDDLARAVRASFDQIKEIRGRRPQITGTPVESTVVHNEISARRIQQILDLKGESKDGMFRAVMPRSVRMPCGCPVGKEMGVSNWFAFGGSDDRAVVSGQFAALDGELQPVLRALRQADFQVTSVQSLLEGEMPRVIFVHFWARGPADELARGIRTALDQQKSAARDHGR